VECTVLMVGSTFSENWADAEVVSPIRMTETGEPEWGEATRLLLFRGILMGGISG
jgi:hypothetical protein